jgi:hypothetical protein
MNNSNRPQLAQHSLGQGLTNAASMANIAGHLTAASRCATLSGGYVPVCATHSN